MSSQVSTSSQPHSEVLREIINDTVVYILSQDHSKYTIKRQDIVKNCLRNYGKSFKSVMTEVQNLLRTVFGMELVDIDKHYLLKNSSIFTDTVEDMIWAEETQTQQVLLLLALSHIFMSGGVVREESMWNFLSSFEISTSTNKTHDYFGDVRKLMTQEFVRQLFLEHTRIPDTNPAKFEFRWGKRAEIEVSQREILKFVSEEYKLAQLTQLGEIPRNKPGFSVGKGE
ncbi:Non-structural maintenance of chromosomes element 3 [Blattella germanica]|nr:Non-structural maintenance of chromosomes element 3 [Blattella germanica]